MEQDKMLWEQNNILREQYDMLWEQNDILREQDNMLWEQNIFLVGRKYLSCGNPQHFILFPQHFILFHQYIISFPIQYGHQRGT
jgi:hypothetical protein